MNTLEKCQSTAHAGEAQSSPSTFAPRTAYFASAFAGVLGAAKTLARNYLKEERVSPAACFNADHHKAVVDLFDAIEHADALGMSLAGALELAVNGHTSAQIWYAQSSRFAAGSMPALIAANDWMKPGDVVYQAQTIVRHTITEDDVKSARPAVIGGAA